MASSVLANNVLVETTTTGTGTLSLGSAVTGYDTFANGGVSNADTVYFKVYEVDADGNPDGDWEIACGAYTTAGTTLARTVVLASSNADAAVNFGAGTKRVAVVAPREVLDVDVSRADGRLTTETGVPVSTSDRTAQGTIYYTPYGGNRIWLFNGTCWQCHTFSQVSLALTATSGKNYDVFLYNNAGTLTLELSAAWTDDNTPADAITTQDGVAVKTGALTRRHVGTIRASGANVTEDSDSKRFVWNLQNQVARRLMRYEVATAHTYGTLTFREWNNGTGGPHRVQFVTGFPQVFAANGWVDMSAVLDAGGTNAYATFSLNSAASEGLAVCQYGGTSTSAVGGRSGLGGMFMSATGFNDLIVTEAASGAASSAFNYYRMMAQILG